MSDPDLASLEGQLIAAILDGAGPIAILGLTRTGLRLFERLKSVGLENTVTAIFYTGESRADILLSDLRVLPVRQIGEEPVGVIVVASDDGKEALLEQALPYIQGVPLVLIAGYGHLKFEDELLDRALEGLLVPSLANGYPNTLTHLFQCLKNASRRKLAGAVVELGMFKGGTTMILSRVVELLGESWPVIGFDTFDGFPARRSPLDMYAHPGCVFRGLEDVRRYLAGRDVEIVPGDIVATCARLETVNLVLTFFDTDNFTPASAALALVREQTVVGGAIVFDHFTGIDRFVYTLGERVAAKTLLDDDRYFNLHGTGVFFRQS